MFFSRAQKKLRTSSSYILLAQGQCLFVLVIYLLDYLPGPFCKLASKLLAKQENLFIMDDWTRPFFRPNVHLYRGAAKTKAS